MPVNLPPIGLAAAGGDGCHVAMADQKGLDVGQDGRGLGQSSRGVTQ